MIDLAAIRERHERDGKTDVPDDPYYLYRWEDAHCDRAALLAEVERLKALCGRAADALGIEFAHQLGTAGERLVAELRAAQNN